MVISGIISGLVIASAISYLASGEEKEEEGARHVLYRLTRNIPLQSVKIIIVAWQILSQVSTVKCQSSFDWYTVNSYVV